jgi:hypothetical protein
VRPLVGLLLGTGDAAERAAPSRDRRPGGARPAVGENPDERRLSAPDRIPQPMATVLGPRLRVEPERESHASVTQRVEVVGDGFLLGQ